LADPCTPAKDKFYQGRHSNIKLVIFDALGTAVETIVDSECLHVHKKPDGTLHDIQEACTSAGLLQRAANILKK
jgi:hypothetical protein